MTQWHDNELLNTALASVMVVAITGAIAAVIALLLWAAGMLITALG